MFAYRGDPLSHRIRLSRALGFWLDYWLFLHSDEAYPLLAARPLGLLGVATATKQSHTASSWTLRRQLKIEVLSYTKVLPFIPGMPPVPGIPLAPDVTEWLPAWKDWLDEVHEVPSAHIITSLAVALGTAVAETNLPAIAFLTRAIAAAHGDEEWTDRQLFILVKREFCDCGAYDDATMTQQQYIEAFTKFFTRRPSFEYEVTVRVAPVTVPRVVTNQLSASPKVLLETDAEGREALVGLQCTVTAVDPEHAANEALEHATTALTNLRLRYYVRTHLHGALKVEQKPTGPQTWLSVPQPFWTKSPGKRAVPRIPKRFDALLATLSPSDRERWHAARWHLSSAFSDWAEDSHSAAAHVWQALEAFAPPEPGGNLAKVLSLVPIYLTSLPRLIAVFLASRLSYQASRLKELWSTEGIVSDWYYWDSRRVDLEKWLGRVFDSRSTNFFGHWQRPQAPSLLFERQVGLLRIASERMRDPATHSWMERRLESDLTLLYSLRNKTVHEGSKILTRRMSLYLAQAGAELLLGTMELLADHVPLAHPSGSLS